MLTARIFQIESTGIQACAHAGRIVRTEARIAKERQTWWGGDIDFAYASDKDSASLP